MQIIQHFHSFINKLLQADMHQRMHTEALFLYAGFFEIMCLVRLGEYHNITVQEISLDERPATLLLTKKRSDA